MRLKGKVTRVSTFLNDQYAHTISAPVALLVDGQHVTIEMKVDFYSTEPDPVGTVKWFELLPEETT